jgi:hypothetical protein
LKSSLDRGLLLKLLNQGFLVVKLKSSLDRGLLLKLLNQGKNPWFSSFSSNPLSSDDFNLTTKNPWFSSFSSNPLSSDDFNLTTKNRVLSG